jgi:hypothetical protein
MQTMIQFFQDLSDNVKALVKDHTVSVQEYIHW